MRKPSFTQTAQASAAKPRKARAQRPIEVADEVVEPATETHSAYDRVRQAADEYFKSEGLVDWKRELINMTLGLIGYGATLYYAVQFVNILTFAAVMYTGVGFISFMVMFLTLMMSFFAAYTVGMFTYRVAAAFDVSKVSARVASFFKRDEVSHA